MHEINHPKDLARLRRIALAAQGLLQARPFGTGLAGASKAIRHLGYVQIDTISVVERAHHHVLHSRVPGFVPAMTNQLLLNGDIFEYWAHAAAFLPIADFRYSLPYKNALKSGQIHWYKTRDTKLMDKLLDRIRVEGPLRSRDVETKRSKSTGWWDWKPAKKALEQLYMQGDLMVSNREGFQKTYDLTERVLPDHINLSMPTMDEFAAWLIDQQLHCHGLVSLKGLTYLRRNTGLRNCVKAQLDARLAEGTLEQVQVCSGEVFVLAAGALQRPMPRMNRRLQILSPFDNTVIQRERLKTLFQYDYQIECYIPEPKRKFGYFCLPLLYGDEFIGRMDCKAHRKTRQLEIKALFFEPHSFDEDAVISAFASAARQFSAFQNCDSVSLGKVEPKHLAQRLRKAL